MWWVYVQTNAYRYFGPDECPFLYVRVWGGLCLCANGQVFAFQNTIKLVLVWEKVWGVVPDSKRLSVYPSFPLIDLLIYALMYQLSRFAGLDDTQY